MSEGARVDRTPQWLAAYEVLKALRLVLQNRQLYGADHPNAVTTIEALATQLATFAKAHGELTLELQARAIAYRGQPLLTVDQPDASPFFPLVQDGVREIVLRPGVPRQELDVLLRALVIDRAAHAEDNSVTLLWEAQLQYIDLVERDPFSIEAGEAGNEYRDLLALALREHLEADSVGAAWRSTFHLMQAGNIDAGQLAATRDGREKRKSLAMRALDPDLLKTLQQELQRPVSDVDLRCANGASRAVAKNAGVDEVLAVRDVMLGVLCNRIRLGDAPRALTLMEHTSKLAGRVPNTEAIPTAFAAPMTTALRDGLRRGLWQGDAADKLWCYLPDAIQHEAFERAIEAHDKPLLSVLARQVSSAGENTGAYLRRQLVQGDADSAAMLVPVVVRIFGAGCSGVLSAAIDRPEPEIRGAALLALFALKPQEAMQRAVAWLCDSDPALRRRGRQALEQARDPKAFGVLEQAIASPFFAERDVDEKRQYLLSAARINRTAGAELARRLAMQGGMLASGKGKDTRIAAIAVLADVADQGAVPLLQAMAAKLTTPSGVKAACAAAIDRIERGRSAGEPARKPT